MHELLGKRTDLLLWSLGGGLTADRTKKIINFCRHMIFIRQVSTRKDAGKILTIPETINPGNYRVFLIGPAEIYSL